MQLDVTNDHIGGSNIEFEEKAINVISALFTGGVTEFPGCEKLKIWCEEFLYNHPIHSNVLLTDQEVESWFEALYDFRLFNSNEPGLYGKPVDYTLLPTTLLKLWGMSDCEY